MKSSDEMGKVYGRLTVIAPAGSKQGNVQWLCRCTCGNLAVVRGGHLRAKTQVSCGCKRDEENRTRFITHGMSQRHPFYGIYKSMVSRCTNKNNKSFKDYGAKGVKCLWQSFEDFKRDMYESYYEHVQCYGERNTSIDRKDPFGHYCLENCRWATWKEQANNRRNNHRQLRM